MKKLLLLFAFISTLAYSQNLCEECVEQNGFYCGDDPVNWTQYSPNGCVPNGPDQFYLNDGWEDCVDASDEDDTVPTTLADCQSYVEPCDTIYVDVPVIDTVYVTEFVIEYIDCDTGTPCNSNIQEFIDKSKVNSVIYNIKGQAIKNKEGLYIEDGKVKFRLK